MPFKKYISLICKALYRAVLLAIIISAFGARSFTSVRAQVVINNALVQVGGNVLSNGQFVHGPNVEGFDLKEYLQTYSPHLLKYADDLYGRSEYYSINPKVYLTLLELHGGVLTNPAAADPFDMPGLDFISQIENISETMQAAYYLHLYTYSALSVSQRNLPAFTAFDNEIVDVDPSVNAGTYAIIAVLARFEDVQQIAWSLDNSRFDGFYQTYIRLFGNDDPLDETNHIYIPGKDDALLGLNDFLQTSEPMGAGPSTPPDGLLQLPYYRGLSWKFGGVHDNSGGGGVGSPLTDASSMDFYPAGSAWGADTSTMWVAASASGVPTKISDCYFKIVHVDGWETTYYHLENIQNFSGSINQNDKIGVIADTLAEAICSGGSATGPHVHFTLRKNGALVAINGTALSGWRVNCSAANGCTTNYDTNSSHMWLERSGEKKYPFNSVVLSEASPPPPAVTISGNAGVPGVTLSYVDGSAQTVTTHMDGSYSLQVPPGWSGTVSPTHPCYSFNPASRTYSSMTENQINQDYSAIAIPELVCVLSITRASPNPANASSVDFTVVFTKPVTGVDTSAPFNDFVLTTTGVTGAAITNVSGSGDTYTVTVNTGSGNGTLRLDVVDDDSILDGANNPLGGVGGGNGNYTTGQTYLIIKQPTFGDVPASNPYWQYIEVLYANGLTNGCNASPLLYCPSMIMNRAQVAKFFMTVQFGGSYLPPANTPLVFQDNWSNNPWAQIWANDMYAKGLTNGCNTSPLLYCPDVQIPREQVAKFSLAIKHGSAYLPPPASGTLFADMTNVNYWATAWAEQAYLEGLVPSCGTDSGTGKPRFCPSGLVDRGLAAYVIVTAKGLLDQ